jgi:hypothetical protein
MIKKFFEKSGVDEFTFGIEKNHGRTEKRDYKLCTSYGWLARRILPSCEKLH